MAGAPRSLVSRTILSIRMFEEENYGVSVRTVFDGRTARATTNKLDDESLKRVVQASETLARRFSILMPICCPWLANATAKPPGQIPNRATSTPLPRLTPEQRAEAVEEDRQHSGEA